MNSAPGNWAEVVIYSEMTVLALILFAVVIASKTQQLENAGGFMSPSLSGGSPSPDTI